METLIAMLTFAGMLAMGLGALGIAACAFADSFGKGLLTLMIPLFGLGSAVRRWPGVVWLWGGGVFALMLGALLSRI